MKSGLPLFFLHFGSITSDGEMEDHYFRPQLLLWPRGVMVVHPPLTGYKMKEKKEGKGRKESLINYYQATNV